MYKKDAMKSQRVKKGVATTTQRKRENQAECRFICVLFEVKLRPLINEQAFNRSVKTIDKSITLALAKHGRVISAYLCGYDISLKVMQLHYFRERHINKKK